MKKILVVVMVLMVGIMFVNPTLGYSDPWGRGPGQVRGPAAYSGHYDRQPYPPPNLSAMKDHGAITMDYSSPG